MEHLPVTTFVTSLVGRELKQGEYRVLDKLGEGGMGVVYRAEQTQLGKIVALKVLLRASDSYIDQQLRGRFISEARIACRLQHTNIAQVFDLWEEQDCHFMTIEYVDGIDLSNIIRDEAPIDSLRALEIMKQLALALEEAERRNIVHRDIKPSNIRLAEYKKDGKFLLKVLDFGIAKRLSDSSSERSQLTEPGTILGTPHYMAPEQVSPDYGQQCRALALREGLSLEAERRLCIEHRADLYAAGVLLFEMLTATLPFTGNQASALSARILYDPPALPESVPPVMRDIVAKLLTRDPYHRMPSASELLGAALYAEGVLRGTRGEDVSVAKSRPPRSDTKVVAVLLLFLIINFSIGITYLLRPRGLNERRKGSTPLTLNDASTLALPQRLPTAGPLIIIPLVLREPPPPIPSSPVVPPKKQPVMSERPCEVGTDINGMPLQDLRPQCLGPKPR